MEVDKKVMDIDTMTTILEAEVGTAGGLGVPHKERPIYRPPKRKSSLGMDVLANAKREKQDTCFKVPIQRKVMTFDSIDEDEKIGSFGIEDSVDDSSCGTHGLSVRHYCGSFIESTVLNDGGSQTSHSQRANESRNLEVSTSRSSRSIDSHSLDNHERNEKHKYCTGEHGRSRHYNNSSRKRSGCAHTSTTPARSDWDDRKLEWDDTPRQSSQDTYSLSSRHRSSPSPMLAGASPDARLVSPWLGTSPCSTASPWDNITPSPTPIHASGSSRSSGSYQRGKHHLHVNGVAVNEDNEAAESSLTTFKSYNITEEMQQEMDYDADRAWYDREEHSTMYDADTSSLFGGEDASYQTKETMLTKKLTCKDGTLMTLAQSKKLSQLTADNAQWEDWQLLRSGAVRGTEVQMDFDDEDESKIILLVHDTMEVVFTKQAEPVMPIKDPTSDMAIIAHKGSALVREIHEKQSMNKSR